MVDLLCFWRNDGRYSTRTEKILLLSRDARTKPVLDTLSGQRTELLTFLSAAHETHAAVRRTCKDFSEVSSLGFLVKSGVFWLELSNLVLSFFSIWSFGERGDFANVTFIWFILFKTILILLNNTNVSNSSKNKILIKKKSPFSITFFNNCISPTVLCPWTSLTKPQKCVGSAFVSISDIVVRTLD